MEGSQMSLFPKFKISSHTPATPATPATFRAESSNSSESSNPRATVEATDDPILSVDAWLPIFVDYHQKVTRQVADSDIWGWSRVKRPELYKQLKAAESDIDNLSESSVHLSEVMKVIERWGALVLQVQFEQNQRNK